MLNKERKERYRKREKKNYRKMTKIEKARRMQEQNKAKKREQNTHVYASWNFVRKMCLQVDLRFAFTLFYR